MTTLVNVMTTEGILSVDLPGASSPTSAYLAQDFRVRSGIEGPQIVITWSNSTSSTPTEYILVRKRGSFPITVEDGAEVYRVVRTGDLFYSDRDLEPDQYYYYTLFSVVGSGDNRFGQPTIGYAFAYETGFFWRYMIRRLPTTYFSEDEKKTAALLLTTFQDTTDADYLGEYFNLDNDQTIVLHFLKRFLRAFSFEFDRIRAFIRFFPKLIDPDETPSEIVPFLSAIIGLEANLDITVDKQRSEIKNWVSTLKRKGTLQSISTFVQSISKFPVELQEYYKNIAVTNDTPNRGVSGSAFNPPTSIVAETFDNFNISVDNGDLVEVTLNVAAGVSGAAIAVELQDKINLALANDGQTTTVEVLYLGTVPNDQYVVYSNTLGETSKVTISTGTNDISAVLQLGQDSGGTEIIGGGTCFTDLEPANVRNSVGLPGDNAFYSLDTRVGTVGSNLRAGFSRSANAPATDITSFINNFQLKVAIDGEVAVDVDLVVSNGDSGPNIAAELETRINERMVGAGYSRGSYAPSTDITSIVPNQLRISVDGGDYVEATLDNSLGTSGLNIALELQTKINLALLGDGQSGRVTVEFRGTYPGDHYHVKSNLIGSTSSFVVISQGTADITPYLGLSLFNGGIERTGVVRQGRLTGFYQGANPTDTYFIVSDRLGVLSSVIFSPGAKDIARILKLGEFFNGIEDIGRDDVPDYLFNYNRFSIFIDYREEFSDQQFSESIGNKIARKLPDFIPANSEVSVWIKDFIRTEEDIGRPNIDIIDEHGVDELQSTNCNYFVPRNMWAYTNDLESLTNQLGDKLSTICTAKGSYTAYPGFQIIEEYEDEIISTDEESGFPAITDEYSDYLEETEPIPETIGPGYILDEEASLLESLHTEEFYGMQNLENQAFTNQLDHLTNVYWQKTSKMVVDFDYIDELIVV